MRLPPMTPMRVFFIRAELYNFEFPQGYMPFIRLDTPLIVAINTKNFRAYFAQICAF